MTIRAVFVPEGSSDAPLGGIIRELFRREELQVDVIVPEFSRLSESVKKDVGSKVRAALRLVDGEIDLFIIHRDADGPDCSPRRLEIEAALEEVEREIGGCLLRVPLVPIHMTEAWALLDEQAIREVSGNPNGRVSLSLPSVRECERRSDPKALLRDALVLASEERGRRLERVKRDFGEHRRRLLERLDPDGPVSMTSSWLNLVADIQQVATVIKERVDA